jgi:hypothetical protein
MLIINTDWLGTGAMELRLLDEQEAASVYGGVSMSSSSGGKGGSSAPQPVNIQLKNVPYVYQYTSNPRSNNFCGLASALMVRAKEKKNMDGPMLWESRIESDMDIMDSNLQRGTYLFGAPLDVVRNNGLLYLDSFDSRSTQWSKTVSILSKLYTAKGTDGVFFDKGHVSSVEAKILSANNATEVIWNHIKNERQPVVIVIDSEIRYDVDKQKSLPLSYRRKTPTLHYNVVMGIKESSGTRGFLVYDPAIMTNEYYFYYTESQLRILMALPSNTPAWVYEYPRDSLSIYDPCYILLVRGD